MPTDALSLNHFHRQNFQVRGSQQRHHWAGDWRREEAGGCTTLDRSIAREAPDGVREATRGGRGRLRRHRESQPFALFGEGRLLTATPFRLRAVGEHPGKPRPLFQRQCRKRSGERFELAIVHGIRRAGTSVRIVACRCL